MAENFGLTGKVLILLNTCVQMPFRQIFHVLICKDMRSLPLKRMLTKVSFKKQNFNYTFNRYVNKVILATWEGIYAFHLMLFCPYLLVTENKLACDVKFVETWDFLGDKVDMVSLQ